MTPFIRLTALALFATLALPAVSFASQTATLTTDSDVYADRSFESDVVNSVDSGETVDVTGCVGKWCRLHIDGPDGWVRKKVLDFTTSALPVPPLPYGADTCMQGYVWRDAIPGDHVCVTPASRATAAAENASAGAHVNPAGAYGANSCSNGYVWREAYTGDVVCVVPTRRDEVHQENADGPGHRVIQ